MRNVLVVDNPKNWNLSIPNVRLISSREYLSNPEMSEQRRLRVFNLCRSYRYQSFGYYVSLLAQARGHTPLPSIATIQDMRSASIARIVADELDELIQRRLKRLRADRFILSIFFGQNMARAYDDLSSRLFRLFQAPLMQARFTREDDEWSLSSIRPIASSEIRDVHRPFVADAAREFFERSRLPRTRKSTTRYDLAILNDPDATNAPSNPKALSRFATAAKKLEMSVEFIEKEDYARLAEFDALFIRETTQVDHHTYRFARRALAEGLVVIDDPDSIIKCTNKVYLAELLDRHRIPTPRTAIISRDSRETIAATAKFPCIIKQPDSSFSQGVFKVADFAELNNLLDRLLEDSELLIMQEFVPTDFDWRIGIIDRKPLFACKYHMVKAHWQIAQTTATKTRYGNVDAVNIDDVPPAVLKYATKAAGAIGDGLYGVDVKQFGKRAAVIEVNDNPNIDAGCEDEILGPALYERVLQTFIDRIDKLRNGARGRR